MNNEKSSQSRQHVLNANSPHSKALSYEDLFPEIGRKYIKVRLKYKTCSFATYSSSIVLLLLTTLAVVASNRPPRFAIDGGQSEIVLRLKESPETAVGELKNSFKLPYKRWIN